jgi:hypothetical protein
MKIWYLRKMKVKNQLKNYDNNFKILFGRVPRREEKEPMRPLYVYYKKLKLALNRRANEKPQPKRMSKEETARKIEELKKEEANLKLCCIISSWSFLKPITEE